MLRSGEGAIVACMENADCWSWAKGGVAIFLAMLVIALLIAVFSPPDWPTLFAPFVFVGIGLPFLVFGCAITAACLRGRR